MTQAGGGGVVIVGARRTAIGSLMGSLGSVSAVEMGIQTARSVLGSAERADIADVIVGNVLQAGQGMNPARQIAMGAGIPAEVPAQMVNRVCGSGLQAAVAAVQAMRAGDGELYLAGGVESMSRAPFLLPTMRAGQRYGDAETLDSVQKDGLTDAFSGEAMGVTAERVATRWGISRAEQDEYAAESHRRAAAAVARGDFDAEIVPIEVRGRKGVTVFARDEHVRPETSVAVLGGLRPAFSPEGTVTAGNSSGLNDGAAMLLLATEAYARSRGLPILAEILGYANRGVDPEIMGVGPVSAVPAALGRAGLGVGDVDLFELNEAFAAPSLAVMRELKLDPAKVNVGGGAVALGHPIGASGARVLVTLAHALRAARKEIGVASLCIGGGMGIAVVLRAR